MKTSRLSVVVIVAFLAGLLGTYAGLRILPGKTSTAATAQESAYDRVMRTGTIRCGYSLWPPFLAKDPNTGQISGIFYDYVEALGEALHLKIDWAGEVGLGDFPTSLQDGRIDAMCLTIWPNASRARQADFTNPIFYTPLYAYVRVDDHRFDNNPAAINAPNIIITTIDGEMGALVAASDFPQAKTLQMPQLANATSLFENVATGKADILFADPGTFGKYNATNPGKLHRVVAKAPIRVFGNTIAIGMEQEKFRRMLNTAIGELLSSGQIEKIIDKYEQVPGTFLRVAPPYAESPGN